MRIESSLPGWVLLSGIGVAVGWGLHCQTPTSHVQVQMGDDCKSCHDPDYQNAQQPLHVGELSRECGDCHANTSWAPARGSSHSWPLEGAHVAAGCSSCHGQEPAAYEGTPADCASCHREQSDAVLEPSHADFSDDCASCHQTSAWQPAAFQHSWPLEGAHASATCASCHGSPPTYQGTPATCSTCHADDRASVVNPPHDAFSDDCSSCHGTLSWDAAAFAHTNQFPLLGAHRTVECSACHTGSPAVFAGTASECVACHQQDYEQSPFPGHSSFATTCQDCHLTSGWVPASGGNHPQGRFSITGRHDYPCNDCHNPSLGPNGAGNADCVGCHEGEHTLARMDNEHAGEVRNYPTGANRAPNFCLQCHPGGNE